jgi:hypothetical protein
MLRKLKDPLQLRAAEQVIQFPYVLVPFEEKTEEELLRIAERKREQGRKLQELAANKRLEKAGDVIMISHRKLISFAVWCFVVGAKGE